MLLSDLRRIALLHLFFVAFGLAALLVAVAAILADGNLSDELPLKKILLAIVGLTVLGKGIDSWYSTANRLNKPTALHLNLWWIFWLGSVNLCGIALYALFSYGLAPLIPFEASDAYRAKFDEPLANALRFLGEGVAAFVRGNSFLVDREIWLIVYCLPVVIATGSFLTLLILVAQHRNTLDPAVPTYLFGFAAGFAVLYSLAQPVLVLDFWYPFAWGRMIVAGINPYYQAIPPRFVQDLPLGGVMLQERMMYGPLWAIVYGVIMWIADTRLWLAVILFKGLLLSAWIGSLWLVWRLLKQWPLWHQCVGLLMLGWLPLGVMQGVAEGHNDVLLVFFILLWLYNLQRGHVVRGSLALAASLLVKYISAPLFLLDFFYALRSRQAKRSNYGQQAVAAGLLLVGGLGLFLRSMEFFAYLPKTSTWHFYSPKEAVAALQLMFHITIPGWDIGTRLIFVGIALVAVLNFGQVPTLVRFREAALAVMGAMLFGVASHIWPWYLLWTLALAALIPSAVLTRWVIGVALGMPFPILLWVVYHGQLADFYIFDAPALFVYSMALLWTVFAPARWFPITPEPNDPKIVVATVLQPL